MFLRSLLSFAVLALTTISLSAHSVWLEPLPDGQLALRFGEWGEDPETSPGHLDALIGPSAIQLKDGEPVPYQLRKQSDHYVVVGSAASATISARCDYAVMERKGESRRPFFHARWWPDSRPDVEFPVTTLDLLPSGTEAGVVLVSFKGKPISAGVELTLHGPDAGAIKLLTDASGKVHLPATQAPGIY